MEFGAVLSRRVPSLARGAALSRGLPSLGGSMKGGAVKGG